MSTTAFAITGGAQTARSGAPAADVAANDASSTAGSGFAAALDEASQAGTAADDAAPVADRAAADAPAAETTPQRVSEPAADAVSAPPIVAIDTVATATPAPDWPPPGLSSLFPPMPLFAAAAPALAAARAATTSASAASAQAAAKAVLVAGPETLPPEPLGPLPALLPSAAATNPAASNAANPAAPNAASLAAAAAAPNPALPGAPLAGSDPIATALARAPVPLPLPAAEERALSGFATLTDSLAPERLPEGVAPLSQATATGLPRLDLAQAFPAPLPLPSPRFAEDLGARLQWVAEQQGGEATLRIAPEGLGPVEVRMKLDGDRVDLGFSASQQETRAALEQALPKLRDMLAQQGLLLGDASVGQQHAGNARDGDPRRATDPAEREREGDEALTALARGVDAGAVLARSTRGMLDLYA